MASASYNKAARQRILDAMAFARAAKEDTVTPEPTIAQATPAKPKLGRPTKATPELIAVLARAIADGFNDEEAALVVGIEPQTLSRWRKENNQDFNSSVKAAQLKRLQKRLDRIEEGQIGWQGTAWILERVHKDRFSRPEVQFAQQINVAGNCVDLTLAPGQLQALSEAYNAEKQASATVELSDSSSKPSEPA